MNVSINGLRKLVEARELAHEIVEATAGGGELAQREPGERGRRHRPQQQGQMCEIAAFGENADKINRVCSRADIPAVTAARDHAPNAPVDGAISNLRARASAALVSPLQSRRITSLDLISQRGALAVGDRRIARGRRFASGIHNVH